MRDLMVYLKTTETCQLNCQHCFTNGTNGKKGWFDPVAVVDFFLRFKKEFPELNSAHISFHGGEPMLCPLERMEHVYKLVDGMWPNLTWGIQTNLTYPMTRAKLNFIKKVAGTSIGTSWDRSIRWQGNETQRRMWEKNVRLLVKEGIDVTVMVCLAKDVLELEPVEIVEYLTGLGVKYVNFERITSDGNARQHSDIIPDNKDLDVWFLKMWEQTLEHGLHKKVFNMFLESVLTSAVYNTFSGCRSRGCEQKILTLNADGSVGGCPNGAVETTFGNIHQPIQELLAAPGRSCNINKELLRHDICYSCDVYDICNGDCHQLNWQGDVCASPKSMMQAIKSTPTEVLREVVDGFMGVEGIHYGPIQEESNLIPVKMVES